MAGCEHRSCGGVEKVWLPHVHMGRYVGLKPHPYCDECGLVKNLSSDRPHRIGYFVNIIAMLSRDYKITQVQMRILAKEMERCRLEDSYGMDRLMQEHLFVNMVKKHLNLPERAVLKLL